VSLVINNIHIMPWTVETVRLKAINVGGGSLGGNGEPTIWREALVITTISGAEYTQQIAEGVDANKLLLEVLAKIESP
jgi:hypothetical protein